MRINFEGSPDELRALVSTIAPGADIIDAIAAQVTNNIDPDGSDAEEDLIRSVAEMQKAFGLDTWRLDSPYVSMHL